MNKRYIMVVAFSILVIFMYTSPFRGGYEEVSEVYTVKAGDTLWSISEDFLHKNTYDRVYILAFMEEIKNCNKELASNNTVYPGQKLNIRYKVKK